MDLQNIDSLELTDRYLYLIREMSVLAPELAEKLEKFGKVRKELQLIVTELVSRGVELETPESLENFIKEELKKNRETEENE